MVHIEQIMATDKKPINIFPGDWRVAVEDYPRR